MKAGLEVDALLDGLEDDDVPVLDKSFTSETLKQGAQSEPKLTIAQAEIPATSVLKSKTKQTKERQFVYHLEPQRCRPWHYHDRMEEALTAERCADLIESIHKEGQKEPVVVRALEGDPDYDYEIIYGRRRHFSCSHISQTLDENVKLKAVIKDIGDDQEAALLTWLENEGQTPITDFERGVYFRRLLGKMQGYDAVFSKQDDLRDKFELDKGKMSKLVKCAELIEYADIMTAIPDRTEIPFTQGYKLAVAMDDPSHKKKILAKAKKLQKGKGKLSTFKVLKALSEAIQAKKAKPKVFTYSDKQDNEVIVCEHKDNGGAHIKLLPGASDVSRRELTALFNSMLDNLYSK